MWHRVSWSAVLAVIFLAAALVSVALEERTMATVCALGAVTWAILSLKEGA